MNKQIIVVALLFSALLSCKKKTDINYDFPPKPERKAAIENENKLAEIFAENAVKGETFTVDAATGGIFNTSKGSSYIIPPNIFVFKDGTPVTGNVDLNIKEITTPAEMILADKPTVTKDGSILQSFGEFKVTASQKAVPVIIDARQKATINVNVRNVVRDSIRQSQEIPMWDGDTIVNYVLEGRDFENNETTLEFQQPFRKGIDWTANGNTAIASGGMINFPLSKLGTWANCDVLIPTVNATTLITYLTNVYNDSSTAANVVFVKVKGINSLIKIVSPILNPPAGKAGFISYQNRFNQGLEGTAFAIVYKGGKLYTGTKEFTVGTPASGKSFYGVDITLEEVTEDQMLAQVAAMNNK